MQQLLDLMTTETGLTWLGKILVSLFIVLAMMVLTRIITMLVRRFVLKKQEGGHHQKTNTVISVLSNVLTVIIVFWGITLILDLFGINTQSLIATAGIGGVAIGFGAQSLVKDVITGAFLLMDDQYALGDYIRAAGTEGYVTQMKLRTTTVRAFNGEITHIPNGSITTVTNISRQPMRALAEIPVPYLLDPDIVTEKLKEALDAHADSVDWYTTKPEIIGITGYSDFHYQMTIVGHTLPMQQWGAERFYRKTAHRIIQSLKEKEAAHGTTSSL